MSKDLGKTIFDLVSSLTPIVNVDLLIKNELGQTLLSWRDDINSGIGWHLPGGIIRLKETIEERIIQTSLNEIGYLVKYDLKPIGVNEIIANEKDIRSHFISILYNCFLSKEYIIDNGNKNIQDVGYLKWFDNCPDDLLKWHKIYRKYM